MLTKFAISTASLYFVDEDGSQIDIIDGERISDSAVVKLNWFCQTRIGTVLSMLRESLAVAVVRERSVHTHAAKY